jgi:hypothetical protein
MNAVHTLRTYFHKVSSNIFLSSTHRYLKWSLPFISRDSTVLWRWAKGWMIAGSSSERGWEFFFFTTASRQALGPTQPPIQWVPGVISLAIKLPGREADQSPPSSAEVKNAWSYTSTPQHAFMAWCSVKSAGTALPLPLLFRFSNQNFVFISRLYCACYIPAHILLLDLIILITYGEKYTLWAAPVFSSLLLLLSS